MFPKMELFAGDRLPKCYTKCNLTSRASVPDNLALDPSRQASHKRNTLYPFPPRQGECDTARLSGCLSPIQGRQKEQKEHDITCLIAMDPRTVGMAHQRHSSGQDLGPQIKTHVLELPCTPNGTCSPAQPSPAPVTDWGSLSALVFFRSQATAASMPCRSRQPRTWVLTTCISRACGYLCTPELRVYDED